ncbi:hypothetical protein JH146_1461 [Methanocaldococcus bathoardescens]|uniref:Uncharacterized protein n=1 Tax=Methanocaldococcus bathoardescens TaxID=1301915 RepID=A0A076LIJ5_9EURY|nr:hypothetical protein [Methanocaldococcus bathoardescens]AIJ06303.1 hypothetical protein JH146_1461 [Methanocaldococcus bathoardescens]
MEDKVREIRGKILDVFVIMLIIYLAIVTYTYLQTNILYNLYFIKTNMQTILGILGIILILLYIPRLKITVYNLYKKLYFSIKSFSLGQKFVLIAIILIIYSAIFLIKNNENYANAVAILSYYFLIFGVLNEFVDYVLEEKINDKINIIKTFTSLILLGVVIHYTNDIKYYFKYLYILIFIIALIYIPMKLNILRKEKNGG